MRDRLIELLQAKEDDFTITCPRCDKETIPETCKGCQYDKEDGSCDYASREADYLLANGVIVPPCKVGDILYALWEIPTEKKYVIYCAEVKEICFSKKNNRLATIYKLEPVAYRGRVREYYDSDFGELVFTNVEEAQAKLKEGGKE